MIQNIYDNEQFFEGYKEIREREYNYNKLLEQPEFMRMLPSVKDKVILDIGCGSGDFAAKCIQNGAKSVHGLDVSSKMLALAIEQHNYPNLQFIHTSIEEANLNPDTYDLVCSSLALHYVEDLDAAFGKISHLLKCGGQLLFSVNHPIVLASVEQDDEWVRDEFENPLYMKLHRYDDESERKTNWLVEGVTFYHKKVSTIVNLLIKHGLAIEEMSEPVPSDEAIKLMPGLGKERLRPSYLFIKAKKVTRF